MRITVLGTGTVGRTLAGRLAEFGHEVVIGTRDPASTISRAEPDAMGAPPYRDFAAAHPGIRLAAFTDAATDAELIVNATSGHAALGVLDVVGAASLAGKVLIDVSNPLDFSSGFPPSLFVKDTDSLGERLQAAFPETRVVKTLNTLNADLMAHPEELADGQHTVFVSGNDADAKAVVTALLAQLGHRDVIDLGDITTARGVEMWLPLWLRIMGALGTAKFNLRIVR